MEQRGVMPHSQEPNQPNSSYWLIPISLRFILILSSHLCLGLPKGLFPADVPVKILKALLLSSILATWPAHLNLLDLISLTTLGEWYKLRSSSLWSLLHSQIFTRECWPRSWWCNRVMSQGDKSQVLSWLAAQCWGEVFAGNISISSSMLRWSVCWKHLNI